MNEINTTADFHPEPSANSTPRQAAAGQPAADMRALVVALTQGENALARRKDLGEMHKRLIAHLSQTSEGRLEAGAAQSAEDRAAILLRLDQVERAVNSMEGALRIELEPMLRATLQEIVGGNATKKPRTLPGILAALLLVAVSAGIGAANADRIGGTAIAAIEALNNSLRLNSTESSPDGGISTASNRVK